MGERMEYDGWDVLDCKLADLQVLQGCDLPCSNEDGTTEVKRVLEVLGLQPSERDCGRVQQICRAVVGRAATLHAVGLSAILSYMCQTRDMETLMVNVGVDGELYKGYSR